MFSFFLSSCLKYVKNSATKTQTVIPPVAVSRKQMTRYVKMASQKLNSPTAFIVSAQRTPPHQQDQQQTSMSSKQLKAPCWKSSPWKRSLAKFTSTSGLNLCV